MPAVDKTLLGQLCEIGPLTLSCLMRRHYTALKAVMRAIKRTRAWNSHALGYDSFDEFIAQERDSSIARVPLRVHDGNVMSLSESDMCSLGMQLAAERVIDFIGWDEPRPTVDEIREFVLILRDDVIDGGGK